MSDIPPYVKLGVIAITIGLIFGSAFIIYQDDIAGQDSLNNQVPSGTPPANVSDDPPDPVSPNLTGTTDPGKELDLSTSQQASIARPLQSELAGSGDMSVSNSSDGTGSDTSETGTRNLAITVTDGFDQRAKRVVRNNGGKIISSAPAEKYSRYIVEVPTASIRNIAADDSIRLVSSRPPKKVTTTDGELSTNADNLHDDGITGSGATIAVIDSQFNPNNPQIEDQVVDTMGSYGGFMSQSGLHGTRSAKMVNDMAPDANLVLVSAQNAFLSSTIDAVESRGDIDAITMSLGYPPNEPMDGSGSRSQLICSATSNLNAPFSTSAGNTADNQHWSGNFTDNGAGYMKFNSQDGSTLPVDWGGGGGRFYVTWNAWGEPSGQDYRVELVDDSGTVYASSNTNSPVETFSGGSDYPNDLSVRIKNEGSSGNHRFHVWSYVAFDTTLETATAKRSINVPARSPCSTAVGAYDVNGDSYSHLEDYSAQGPTSDGRTGVDVVAPTGIGGFYGTSASAPHVGGAYALLEEAAPNSSREQMKSALKDTAISPPKNTAPSPAVGAGAIDAQAAVGSLNEALQPKPPVASDQSISTDKNQPITVSFNASDPNPGDSLSYEVSDSPSSGTVDVTGGSFEYVPDYNTFGTDSFEYTVTDSDGYTDVATVTIDVAEVYYPPIATDMSVSTTSTESVSASFNASDRDSSSLSYSITSDPTDGSVALTGDTFSYYPDTGYTGADSFEYTAEDSQGNTDTGTVSIAVDANSAPLPQDITVTVIRNASVSGQLDATDPEGDSIAYSITDPPSSGSVTTTDDSFEYTPDRGFIGTDSFVYTADDNTGDLQTSNATVTLDVVANQPPTADSMTISTAPGDDVFSAFTASDPEGYSLSYSIITQPTYGTATLQGSDGAFEYEPGPEYTTNDTFDYRVTDPHGGSARGTVVVNDDVGDGSGGNSRRAAGGDYSGGTIPYDKYRPDPGWSDEYRSDPAFDVRYEHCEGENNGPGVVRNIETYEYQFGYCGDTNDGPFYSIFERLNVVLLTGITSLGTISLLVVGSLYYTNKLPERLLWRNYQMRARRYTFGTFLAMCASAILYTGMWIATDSQETPESLPANGVFGTGLEEAIIGPDVSQALGGLVAQMSTAFTTYRTTAAFLSITLLVYSVVSYMAVNNFLPLECGSKKEALYRSTAGFVASLCILPLVYVGSWLGTGYTGAGKTLSRVAPTVELPVHVFSDDTQPSQVTEISSQSKDPFEMILLRFMEVNATLLFMIALTCITFALIAYFYTDKMQGMQRYNTKRYIRSGLVITLIVGVLPALLTATGWVMTGETTGDVQWQQNIEGTPFHHEDDFGDCNLGEWTEIQEKAVAAEDKAESQNDCHIEFYSGTIEKSFDFQNMPQDQGQVTVNVNDGPIVVTIFNGENKIIEENIQTNRRFEFEMTAETTIQLYGAQGAAVDSVEIGATPMPDPLLVAEVTDAPDEILLRNGLQAEVKVWNLGEAYTDEELNLAGMIDGTKYDGSRQFTMQRQQVKYPDGSTPRETAYDYNSLPQLYIENKTVREIAPGERETYYFDLQPTSVDPKVVGQDAQIVADLNWVWKDQEVKGGGWNGWDKQDVEVYFADLRSQMADNRTVHNRTNSFEVNVTNHGTGYISGKSTRFRIVNDETGNRVADKQLSHGTINAAASDVSTPTHSFRVPGNYTVTSNTDDSFIPYGNTDQMNLSVIHGDTRVNIAEFDSDTRVGEKATAKINVSNKGNDYISSVDLSASVEGPDGSTVETFSWTVTDLEVGEIQQFTFDSIEVTKEGDHTLTAEAPNAMFPYGASDRASMLGVGPGLSTSVSASNVFVDSKFDATVTFESTGTDVVKNTTATVDLATVSGTPTPAPTIKTRSPDDINSSVAVFEEQTVAVPTLPAGSTHTVGLNFTSSPSETGEYYVEVDANPVDAGEAGTADSAEFSVVTESLVPTISAPDVNTINENTATVTIKNEGTGVSTSKQVSFTRFNTSGAAVRSETLSVPALDSGETHSQTVELTHNEPGTHEVSATVDGLSANDTYDMSWPQLVIDVTPDKTRYDTVPSTVDVSVENTGSYQSEPTDALTQLFTAADGETLLNEWDANELAYNDTQAVPSLAPGEQYNYTIDAIPPYMGNYTIKGTVDDTQMPAGNTDTYNSDPITRVGTQLGATSEDIVVGENTQISLQLLTNRRETVDPQPIDVEIVNNDTGAVHTSTTVTSPPVDPHSTTEFSIFENTSIFDTGEYVVHAEVDNASWNKTYRTASSSFTVGGSRVQLSASDVFLNQDADIQATVQNIQAVATQNTTGQVTLYDSGGTPIESNTVDIPSVPTGEEVSFPVLEGRQMTTEGDYTVAIDVAASRWADSQTRDRQNFSVLYSDTGWNVEGVTTTTQPSTTVDVELDNAGTGDTDPQQVMLEIAASNGTVIQTTNLSFDSVRAGGTTSKTVNFDPTLRDDFDATLKQTNGNSTTTLATDQFSITWPEMVPVAPDVVTDSDTVTIDIPVRNPGTVKTGAMTTTIEAYDSFDLLAPTSPSTPTTVTIPEVAPGQVETVSKEFQVRRIDTYDFELTTPNNDLYINEDVANDSAYSPSAVTNNQPITTSSSPPLDNDPAGEEVSFHKSDLVTTFRYDYDETRVYTQTTGTLIIKNIGDRPTQSSKTIDITSSGAGGTTTKTKSVGTLQPGESSTQAVNFTYGGDFSNTEVTATSTVDTDAFSWNDDSSDTIDVVAPYLETSLSINNADGNGPTVINQEQVYVSVEIKNTGELSHPRTEGTFKWLNPSDRRVDKVDYEVPRLEPGESHTVEFDYQLYDDCWQNRMSCAPGAQVDLTEGSSEFDATFNVKQNETFQPTPDPIDWNADDTRDKRSWTWLADTRANRNN
jgi:hypothetical protein